MASGLPPTSEPAGQISVPGFGLQLQDHATFGIPEVRVELTRIETGELFEDGELIMLREPRIAVMQPNGGRKAFAATSLQLQKIISCLAGGIAA